MNPFHRNAQAGRARRRSATVVRLGAGWIAALGLSFGAGAAQADGFVDNDPADAPAPWTPAAVAGLTDEPYSADPGFHGGEYIEDAFFANQNGATNYFDGKKVVRLGNGDIVAAALVKNPNGNQTNGLWNIGLVRYDAAGAQRLAWSNAGTYAHAGGQYVVFPKTDTANYSWIQDIKAIDGKILVAVNLNFGGSDDIDTQILVFGEDGSFKDEERAFGSGAAEYVGGMEVYQPAQISSKPQVLVVATSAPRDSAGGGIGRPQFRRYSLEAGGALTDETGVLALNTHWCADVGRDCRPAGIALGFRGFLNTPSIYVVNRYYQPAADQPGWSVAVTKIDPNGSADSSWPGNWWYQREDGTPGAHRNWPVAIAVRTSGLGLPVSPYRDSVFVISETDRPCGNGILALRFEYDGSLSPGRIFGGSNASGALCTAIGRPTDWPVDVALSGDRLAVAGFGRTHSIVIGGEASTNAFVAILDTTNAGAPALLDLRDYTYPIRGARERHSGFWGITPTENGRFVAVGDSRFRTADSVPESLRGKTSVALLGIAPDRIFGNGFGSSRVD